VASTLLASLLLVAGAGALWTSFEVVGGGPPDVGQPRFSAASPQPRWRRCGPPGLPRLRLRFKGRRRTMSGAPAPLILVQLAAGVVVAGLLVMAERFFASIVQSSSIDLRHFSLDPWNTTRMALLGGLLALHLAVLWTATLVFAAAPSPWRLARRGWKTPALLLACWVLPIALAVAWLSSPEPRVPPFGVLASGVACAVAALLGRGVVAVPPRDGGCAHPLPVRRVPGACAAALPVDQLPVGTRRAALDYDAI
jgi:hypothetical protein